MSRELIIDGSLIKDEKSFHDVVANVFSFPDYYGRNLDAFWDCISGAIDTDILVVWKNHKASEAVLGDKFESIIGLFKDLRQEYPEFSFRLE